VSESSGKKRRIFLDLRGSLFLEGDKLDELKKTKEGGKRKGITMRCKTPQNMRGSLV